MKKLVLASESPRRKELLEKACLDFQVEKHKYKEKFSEKFDIELIKKISHCKAQSVANTISYDAIVISADTIVILDSVCLIKPHNYNEAFFCLKKLSGKWHSVITSVTLIDTLNHKSLTETLETKVKFRELKDFEIKNYIDNFKPFDKAGSYGIQDFVDNTTVKNPPESSFIEKIEGDYENVMGLSVKMVLKMLQKFK